MKSTKKTSERALTPESVLGGSLAILQKAVDALEIEMDSIIAGRGPKSKYEKDARIAHLAGRVNPIVDTVRKLMASDQKQIARLTPAIVMAWLRRLEPDDRAQFLAEAAIAHGKRSGLA